MHECLSHQDGELLRLSDRTTTRMNRIASVAASAAVERIAHKDAMAPVWWDTQASLLCRATVRVFGAISGDIELNQRFRLAAQDVRFQPVVEVQP